MNCKQKLLATAVAVAATMASGAYADHPSLITRTIDNSNSSASFAGGATLNGGISFLTQVPATSAAGVSQIINPASGDVGAEGDLYQVVNTGSGWYMRSPTGFVPWDTRVASLVSFQTKTLAAEEEINLADVESELGLDLDGSTLRVHVGYASDSTVLTYSSAAEFELLEAATACPAGTEQVPPIQLGGNPFCILSGTVTSDLTLNASFDYILSGAVFIGGDNTDSAELTIDAGVTVYGESGNDFLVVNRGSKIHVNGTEANPVVMTSANDATADTTTRGQWGGLIINGNAPINGCTAGTAVCEAQGEGSTGTYGGNDPMDDSGNLNYLIVKYAGFEISPENELNGIAFQAVGAGTEVDYVQVHNNSDDGVEFFGGTVNAKHLVLTGIGDDSVDWTFGWEGKLQHVIVVQKDDDGDQGIEADNNADDRDSLPRSQPSISNITLIGNANTDLGMLLREGTGANITNAVVTGFGDACIDIDHSATFAAAGTSATSLTGVLTMTNSAVDCDTDFDEEADDNWSVADWFNGQSGNVATSLNMDASSYINSSVVNGLTPATQTDSFFDQTTHVGAVADAESDWAASWIFVD